MPATVPAPYRLLFPIGCLFALWGVGLWLAYAAGGASYPGAVHADLMIGGFLGSFVIGFLMTALPRFTATWPASRAEIGLALALALSHGPVAALASEPLRGTLAHALLLAQLVALALFAARRFVRRRSSPPPAFSFLAVGLLAGLAGSLLLLVAEGGAPMLLGRALLFHGFVPALVIGVGARIFPALLGWMAPPDRAGPPVQAGTVRAFLLAGALFLASFPLEVWAQTSLGRALRAAVVTWIAFRFWRLHRLPVRRGAQPFSLWACGWTFVIGLWGEALWPAQALQVAHLSFVAGLGLTTFLVATRVTLSHGGHPMQLEGGSRALWAASVLALLATAVRVLALLAGAHYFGALAIAAALWVAAVVVWTARFGPMLVKVETGAH